MKSLNQKQIKFYLYTFVACFALQAFYHAVQLQDIYEPKLKEQERNTRNASQIRGTYSALAPTLEAWNSTFVPANDIISIVSLFKLMRIHTSGLIPNSNELTEGSVDIELFEGKDIGLIKRCLKNGPTGFMVESTSLQNLIDGMQNLDNRHDIKWDDVVIGFKNNKPHATFNELCLINRL